MTAALRHPAVRVDPVEPCPFCGSHGLPLREVSRPPVRSRKNGRVRRYYPCTCAFCEEGRRLSAVPGHSAHTVGQIVAATPYLGGNCITAGTRYAQAAQVSPAYQAHLDAGEVAVPDVAAGGYRWEKKGETAA